MNHHSSSIAAFLFMLSLFGPQAARAGPPAGQVTQLSGFVMAVKANGALKVLSPQSVVEAGDTLVSEENTYVRIGLADGRQAVLGPQTRLEFTSATALNLTTGQLQVVAAAPPGTGRLTIASGGTTVDAGTGNFNLFYRPDPATALARRAYAQASLASIASPVQSDAGTAFPLWEQVATTFIQQYVPAGGVLPNPGSGVRLPGLYVQVTNGAILVSNAGGSQNFSAGQFGFTPTFRSPPVLLPANPGLKFSPPPVFSAPAAGSTGSTAAKSVEIDCEVR
jgi:hypothetical protein